jgi:hypothetical protein
MALGADVNFEKAEFYFQEVQRMITHFNRLNPDIQFVLSSLEDYGRAVGKEKQPLYSFSYDMMPYSDDGNRYFTGQYSSRPSIKTAVRKASSVLHSANKLYVS